MQFTGAGESLMIGTDYNSRNCPICDEPGHTAQRLINYDHDIWKLGCCKRCRFVYLLNPPGKEELIDEFAFEKTFVARREQRKSALREATAMLRAFLAKFKNVRSDPLTKFFSSGHVLDVGCGSGGRVQSPAVPYGIEISRHLFELADEYMRARGGYCVHASGSEGIVQFGQGQFDGVLMNSYLEHEVDVIPVLRGAHRCLKPDGKLFLRVPNYASFNRRLFGRSWCGFRYPDHVNYFTPDSLGKAVAMAGFKVRILNRFRLPIDDNIHALLTKLT